MKAYKEMPEDKRADVENRYTKEMGELGYGEETSKKIAKEEVAAAYAEELFHNSEVWDYVLSEEPSLKDRVLSFFKGANKKYSFEPGMTKAAKKWLKEYKRLFNELGTYNKGQNAADNTVASEGVKRIEKIGRLEDGKLTLLKGNGTAENTLLRALKPETNKNGSYDNKNGVFNNVRTTMDNKKSVSDSGERAALRRGGSVASELAEAISKGYPGKPKPRITRADAEKYIKKLDARYEVKVAKTRAKMEERVFKAEAKAEAKAEEKIAKAKEKAEERAERAIKTKEAQLKAEYTTDTVFSQSSVKSGFDSVAEVKKLPTKVRNEVARDLWLDLELSDDADVRDTFVLEYSVKLYNEIREADYEAYNNMTLDAKMHLWEIKKASLLRAPIYLMAFFKMLIINCERETKQLITVLLEAKSTECEQTEPSDAGEGMRHTNGRYKE